MNNDLVDKVLGFLGSFDFMTPLTNEASSYTVLEYSGSYADALAHMLALEKEGIPCRLEGGGLFTNACVYTRPSPTSRSQANEVTK